MDAEIPYTRLRADASALQKNGNVRALPGRKIDIASTEAVGVREADELIDLWLVFAEDESNDETAAAI